ncbi:hypothetical protein WJX72_011272 [[Myrmecia] bisecta]|uniref:Protein ENHANCED DISEASE RESISTANCE 2 C-terminal domain-containing protein n=1 Tax=[Myrmecia] bisecta TaxID=41462 RepID=A0AAW1QC56_9CHLO
MVLQTLSFIASLAAAVALPHLTSVLKGYLVDPRNTQLWRPNQEGYKQKRWKPNKRHRGVIWPVLYFLLGLASWLVWRQGGLQQQVVPLLLYMGLLVTNILAWPPLFYGGRSLLVAAFDCAALLGISAATIAKFYEVRPMAGLLLLPYLGWTCFATTLINCSVHSRDPRVLRDAQRLVALKRESSVHGDVDRTRLTALSRQRLFSGASIRNETQTPPGRAGRVSPGRAGRAPMPVVPDDPAEGPPSDSLESEGISTPASETGSSEDDIPMDIDLLHSCPAPAAILRQVSMRLSATAGELAERAASIAESTPILRPAAGLISRMSSICLSPRSSLGSPQSPISDTLEVGRYFSEPGSGSMKVRGKTYLKDRKKIPAPEPACRLSSVNLMAVDEPTFHIARFLPSIHNQRAPFTFVWQIMVPGKTPYSLTLAWSLGYDPEVACGAKVAPPAPSPSPTSPSSADAAAPVGLHASTEWDGRPAAPGPGSAAALVDVATSIAAGRRATEDIPRMPYSPLAERRLSGEFNTPRRRNVRAPVTEFVDKWTLEAANLQQAPAVDPALGQLRLGLQRIPEETEEATTANRHGAFKIIPRIEKGSWVVKHAVGQNTPVLLGQKLVTKYFRGPRYIEVDVDVGSSTTASSVVGMVQGALKSLVIDLAVLLQGRAEDELPEALLGSVRLAHLDLAAAPYLDTKTAKIVPREQMPAKGKR